MDLRDLMRAVIPSIDEAARAMRDAEALTDGSTASLCERRAFGSLARVTAPTQTSPPGRDAGAPQRPAGSLVRPGLRVAADAARLLARFWPALVTVVVLAEVLHELALRAALAVAPTSGVLGLLVLCLAPLASVVGIVVMLHVMRREGEGRLDLRTLVRSIASVLVPYLVIYEFYGGLSDDWQTYIDQAALDHAFAAADGAASSDPVPDGFGLLVVATVGGALLLRTVLERLARRADASAAAAASATAAAPAPGSQHDGAARRRTMADVWRILAGYCEVVWIVVGAFTVAAGVRLLRDWWSTRAVVVSVQEWWREVTTQVEVLRVLSAAVDPATSLLVAGIVTGLVVPLAWLTLGTIVYGVEAIDVVDPEHATKDAEEAGRTARVVDRFNRTLGAQRAQAAWRFMLDPGRRFGGLVGAVGMLWRSRWGAVLLFCIAFTLVTLAEQAVLAATGAIVGQPGIEVWRAVIGPVDTVARLLVQVLTTALLAAAADSLLANLGLPTALRVRRRRQPVVPGAGNDQ